MCSYLGSMQDMNMDKQQEGLRTAEQQDDIMDEDQKSAYELHEKEIDKDTKKQSHGRLGLLFLKHAWLSLVKLFPINSGIFVSLLYLHL